jgi:CubicO group peptidase (beta-lactamase class C family)
MNLEVPMPKLFIRIFAVMLMCALTPANAATSADTGDVSLGNLKAAAAYSAQSNGVSMLVIKDGRVIFEDYPNGHNANQPHELASGTKSFAGVAALAAQQDGLLSLDEKVADTITEWQGDPQRQSITIRQLLTLTSGVKSASVGHAPPYAEAIKAQITASPGQKFQYGPAPFQIFGELMRRKLAKTHETMVDYLRRRVLTPAGVQIGFWRKGEDGMPFIPQGGGFTARDWGQFGQLVMNGGEINGKQILKAEDLKTLFEGTAANPMYGLTWWLNRPIDEQKRGSIRQLTMASDLRYGSHGVPNDVVMAAGAGKQRLYLIPSRHLIIVRQADKILQAMTHGDETGFSDTAFLQLVFEGTTSQTGNQARSRSQSQSQRYDPSRRARLRQLIQERRRNR